MPASRSNHPLQPTHGLWSAIVLLVALVGIDSTVAQDLKLKFDLTPQQQQQQQQQQQIPPLFNIRINGRAVTPAPPARSLPEPQPATEEELAEVAFNLASPEFSKRKAASERMKTLPLKELRQLALKMADSPSAEAIVRVHSELELRYHSESLEERKNASELLERMAQQERLLSADPATHSLQKYWKTRIEVALEELKELGAIIRNGNFSQPQMPGLPPDSRPAVQVLLTESWHGGDAGLEVFRRLESLGGPTRSLKGIQVYLLTGYTLTQQQEKQLFDIVGANRIQRRSRVALGITGDPGTQGIYEGILIKGVSKGGSADKAGLGPGDFILAMYDDDQKVPLMKFDPESWRTFRRQDPIRELPLAPERGPGRDQSLPDEKPDATPDAKPDTTSPSPHRLLDFDQLVERLKQYKPGDKVKLQVVKKFQNFNPMWAFPNLPRGAVPDLQDARKINSQRVVEVQVELIGWEHLPMVK